MIGVCTMKLFVKLLLVSVRIDLGLLEVEWSFHVYLFGIRGIVMIPVPDDATCFRFGDFDRDVHDGEGFVHPGIWDSGSWLFAVRNAAVVVAAWTRGILLKG